MCIRDRDMSAGDKMLLKVNNYSGSVIWVSGDKSVVTVDEKGYVYAVSEGSTTIFAICGNTSLICKVTVSADIDENEVDVYKRQEKGQPITELPWRS